MKVIRLNEAEYEQADSGLYVPKGTVSDAQQDEPKQEYTNVDIKSVQKAFEQKGLDDISGDKALAKLEALFKEVGTYNNLSAANIYNVLKPFGFKFTRYFLECLGYENLGDKSNLILTAFANPSAQQLINGDKALFTTFYNIVNGNKFPVNYLADEDALLFNRPLYRKAPNEDVLEDVIVSDIANLDKPQWRKVAKENIDNGNFGQFASKEIKQDRKIAQATETWDSMSDKQKHNFLTSKGVKQNTAIDVVNQIKSNEVNNK